MSISRIGGGAASYAQIVQEAAARRAASAENLASRTGSELAGPGRSAASPAAAGLESSLRSVHESQANADKMVLDLASGQDVNIHNTMIELEKAEISMKYAVQLRNRALQAYEELMRIQL
jgi:flagellar hook-basal body complex protein FliE